MLDSAGDTPAGLPKERSPTDELRDDVPGIAAHHTWLLFLLETWQVMLQTVDFEAAAPPRSPKDMSGWCPASQLSWQVSAYRSSPFIYLCCSALLFGHYFDTLFWQLHDPARAAALQHLRATSQIGHWHSIYKGCFARRTRQSAMSPRDSSGVTLTLELRFKHLFVILTGRWLSRGCRPSTRRCGRRCGGACWRRWTIPASCHTTPRPQAPPSACCCWACRPPGEWERPQCVLSPSWIWEVERVVCCRTTNPAAASAAFRSVLLALQASW